MYFKMLILIQCHGNYVTSSLQSQQLIAFQKNKSSVHLFPNTSLVWLGSLMLHQGKVWHGSNPNLNNLTFDLTSAAHSSIITMNSSEVTSRIFSQEESMYV